MQKDSTDNTPTFIRPTSKRSQTFISTSAVLVNYVPTIRPKSNLGSFSPLLLFKLEEKDENDNAINTGDLDLNGDPRTKEAAFQPIAFSNCDRSTNTASTSTSCPGTTKPSFLTPQLKKGDTILGRLLKRKESTLV